MIAERVAPSSAEELAGALREASERERPVRVRGGGTKLHWGVRGEGEPALEVSTEHLDGLIEHNAGDMTAVLEAGTPLHRAQQAFAAEGQMLALDPPDPGGAATLGGVVAAADSGPLRSRYGAARDLVLGVRVALSDGTLAQAGGKVIKNVAGYDLAKLFAGSFGTLGAIVQLSVRLHPLPPSTATAVGGSDDPAALAAAASALAHAPLEQYMFDVQWANGRGAVLSRFAGASAAEQAQSAAALLREARLETEAIERDEPLWDAQREGQRATSAAPTRRDERSEEDAREHGSSERDLPAGGIVLRVSALQTQLVDVLRCAERHDATLVGRAGLGLGWLRLAERAPADAIAAVEEIRRALSPAPCVVLDAPAEVRAALDPWDGIDPGVHALMRRVKERFDAAGTCAPGVLV
jgi:glycolate oxidase FAD binding subunit